MTFRKLSCGAIVALVVGLGIAGCGSGQSAGSINKQTLRRAAATDGSAAEMRRMFRIEAEGKSDGTGGMDYRIGNNECSVAVFLTTPAQVQLYADAGDDVVTNVAQTFGVKIVPYQGSSAAACAREAQQVLAVVR